MDQLERTLGERLGALGAGVQPPATLAARIRAGVRVRRRRRRVAAVTAAGLSVVVLAAAVALLAPGRAEVGPPAAPRPAPTLGLVSRARPAPWLAALTGATTSTELTAVGSGLLFRADALGPDGVLAGGTGYDGGSYRASDRRVWAAPPGAAPTPLSPPVVAWAPAVGAGVVAWAQHTDGRHDFELVCGGRQVGDRGVDKSDPPVHVDGDVVVWTDEQGQARTVTGCAGTPRPVPAGGRVVAFARPDVFVLEAGTGAVVRVDLTSGARTPVPGMPRIAPGGPPAWFAASPSRLAWVWGGALSVLDRATGRVTKVPAPLPSVDGVGATVVLTAGERLVVYSVRPMEADPAGSRALVYDLISGRYAVMESEAYAAGDRLAWREGTAYRVALVDRA